MGPHPVLLRKHLPLISTCSGGFLMQSTAADVAPSRIIFDDAAFLATASLIGTHLRASSLESPQGVHQKSRLT
jgi:hypothetical protein